MAAPTTTLSATRLNLCPGTTTACTYILHSRVPHFLWSISPLNNEPSSQTAKQPSSQPGRKLARYPEYLDSQLVARVCACLPFIAPWAVLCWRRLLRHGSVWIPSWFVTTFIWSSEIRDNNRYSNGHDYTSDFSMPMSSTCFVLILILILIFDSSVVSSYALLHFCYALLMAIKLILLLTGQGTHLVIPSEIVAAAQILIVLALCWLAW